MRTYHELADVAVVGAGAAGLMAACWAARSNPALRVVALDGAVKLGAKILVAGGGRCNVTHDEVDERAYAGSTRPAIRKVLKRFDVPETVAFFEDLGVPLKREPNGKLFPVTDQARTVLEALLRSVEQAGARIWHPRRVDAIEREGEGFLVRGAWGELPARRVILATGGKSLPKSGSDGAGYGFAQALGHSLTPRITPSLVPLMLPKGHVLTELSGLSADVRLTLSDGRGKSVVSFENALLCTHFGLSGPAALDISRYVLAAMADDPQATLSACWLPDLTPETVDAALLGAGKTGLVRWVGGRLPERLTRTLAGEAGIDPSAPLNALTRPQRQALGRTLTAYPLPVTGDRGYTYAEVTAGGVPLSEIDLKTMESRLCSGLHVCGEICDVDGQIGGYNFQWAWASGYVAGLSAAHAL
jgi:predicted Rossmann fold flavoprotein